MNTELASASSAYLWLHELLDLLGSQPTGRRGPRQCPAHPDSSPSLAVAEGANGSVLVYCHGGCATQKVLSALRISQRHLFLPSPLSPAQHQRLLAVAPNFPPVTQTPGRSRARGRDGYRLKAVHDYGEFLLLRWRHPMTTKKRLSWERRDPTGVWIPGLGGTELADLPLYDERQLRYAIGSRERVVVVESESSVDALTKKGLYATTWAGGAGNPQLRRLAASLGCATVLVVPDNDQAGIRCGEAVATALKLAGATVSTLLPDKPGMDARDLLDRDGVAAFS